MKNSTLVKIQIVFTLLLFSTIVDAQPDLSNIPVSLYMTKSTETLESFIELTESDLNQLPVLKDTIQKRNDFVLDCTTKNIEGKKQVYDPETGGIKEIYINKTYTECSEFRYDTREDKIKEIDNFIEKKYFELYGEQKYRHDIVMFYNGNYYQIPTIAIPENVSPNKGFATYVVLGIIILVIIFSLYFLLKKKNKKGYGSS